MPGIEEITATEPGFLTIRTSSGPPTKYPLADILRAVDIPIGLTHTQVDGIRILANLMVIVVRTLIGREILDEDFADDSGMEMSLEDIIHILEQLGGSYSEPDFDALEDA